MDEMYVLIDANGFTSCCAMGQAALLREVSRRPMLAPIRVFHWRLHVAVNQRVVDHRKWGEWRKVQEFDWSLNSGS